jgi:hypothetical protein
MLNQSAVQCDVKTAEKICAPVKTAVFICPAHAAIAVKQARKDNPIKNGLTFAIGFRLTQNSVPQAQESQKSRKKLKPQKPHLITFLNNYE